MNTGDDNIFIGCRAGRCNTGDSNIFMGACAGYDNTSGAENVFIGKVLVQMQLLDLAMFSLVHLLVLVPQ